MIPPLQILYADDQLVVVYKPAGLLFHRHGWDRQGPFLLQTLRDQLGCPIYPVHRLDRPTAGLVIFALSADSARFLALAFRHHCIRKDYWAICRGFAPDRAVIDHPLPHPDNDYSQDAISLLICRARCELPMAIASHPTSRYSLVQLRPLHGRTHQLRRHMAHLRHPIIGDVDHGDGKHNRLFRDLFQPNRLLLCALRLRLPHPGGGFLHIKAKPDEEFIKIVDTLFPLDNKPWPTIHQSQRILLDKL